MQTTYYVGIALEILAVAAVAAALFVLALRLIKKSAPPALPEKQGWFAGGNMRILLWAAIAALGSRLLLVVLAYFVLFLARTFGGAEVNDLLQKTFGPAVPSLEALFSHWDAPHYLDIARWGYTSDLTVNGGEQHWFIVFYPLYPALIALLKPLLGTQFSAGTFLSWACLAGACYWMYRLAMLDAEKSEARRAIKYLLVFPAAVFLGAPYTESLFLLLTALCLYALRKRQFWLAGILGFFAALTRNLGALLAFPFLVELLDSLGVFADRKVLRTGRFWLDFVKKGAWVLLIPLAVGVYLLVNQIAYGDPFMFMKIQDGHWYQHAQPFWKTVLTTWSSFAGTTDRNLRTLLWGPQLAGMAAMLLALPFLMKKLRPSYAAYLLVYVVVVLTPSNLLSFNRYMMGCVPLFLGLAAMMKNKWSDRLLTVVFFVMMLYLGAGFIMWGQVV